ncbi:hypothetical protein G3I77_02365 [Streptomyces sp. D2-8]|uniref:hypothetical protein n=1 Tax=Streptomyces sp. D2-8 TaxID=2707767 RepID=UPI0020BD89FE|nr:hypothetical protein [Streptomyces sp. D2-8]MCK8431908.1 hypothetical protein [Streptomyces sp. D2-8]
MVVRTGILGDLSIAGLPSRPELEASAKPLVLKRVRLTGLVRSGTASMLVLRDGR